jgi:hypothetical protein
MAKPFGAHMASMLQGSGTGEYKMEEHKAVEDRGVAAVQDRKKLCSNLVSMQPRWMRNCALNGGVRRPWRRPRRAGPDRVLGFAMIGSDAGEVTVAVQIAMMANLPYTTLRDAILTHPTMAEGLNTLFGNVLSRIGRGHARQ